MWDNKTYVVRLSVEESQENDSVLFPAALMAAKVQTAITDIRKAGKTIKTSGMRWIKEGQRDLVAFPRRGNKVPSGASSVELWIECE